MCEHIDNADKSFEQSMAEAAAQHVPDPDVYQVVAELRTALAAAERERDAAKAEVERLRGAATNLLRLIDDVGTPDGDESDRVFARYEFDELRAALTPAPPQAKENTP